MKTRTISTVAVAVLGASALCAAWLIGPGTQPEVEASDHNDPPGRVMGASADRAADIADLFVFTRGENTVFAVTLAGPAMPTDGQAGTYDRDVLLQVWYDEDGFGTGTASKSMDVRFAQNSSGNWGVSIEGIPGATGAVTGSVERINSVPAGGQF